MNLVIWNAMMFALLGLIIGSFLNVIGMRVPAGKPFVDERSECPHCGHQLRVHELIPLVSYMIQGGKCRSCKAPISRQYPFVEAMTGLLFLLSYAVFGLTPELGVALVLSALLVIVFVADVTHMLIPDKILLFFLPLLAVGRILVPLEPWWDPIAGMITGFGIIVVVIFASFGGMGGGDMKLFALLGIVLGWKLTLVAFVLACIIGAVTGLIGMAMGVVKRGKPFPFGPSIVVAVVVTYFYGDMILSWYMSLFI